MAIPKVILIGGAPYVGKSATARCVASCFRYGCLSTDDIGKAVGCLTTKDTHPKLHISDGIGYQEYFADTSVPDLISHAHQTRVELWPAFEFIIRTHAEWGDPIVVEGYTLWPEQVQAADFQGTEAVWLICDDELFERRIRSQPGFYSGASDEEKLIVNMLQRSIRYNELVLESCRNCGARVVAVEAQHTAVDVAGLCVSVLSE